jgi:hypothetical protein
MIFWMLKIAYDTSNNSEDRNLNYHSNQILYYNVLVYCRQQLKISDLESLRITENL